MFRTTCKAALLLATTSCLTLGYAAHAQQSENTNEAAGDESLVADTVIVTGTRQAQRTVFSSLAPIDVVSGEAIESTSSEDLLDTVAQLVPSFKVQRLPMADGNIFVRPATLRGLGRNHTLVLVNGKRRHRSALLGAGTDLASIPSFAIKRIEVLRDGASAQYGSDAIAGVINIILDDEPGYAAYGQFSQYYEGDGTNYQAGAQAGWELGQGGHLVTTLEYYDAERTSRSRQRPDAIELQANNPDLDVPNPVQHWGQPDRSATRQAPTVSAGLSRVRQESSIRKAMLPISTLKRRSPKPGQSAAPFASRIIASSATRRPASCRPAMKSPLNWLFGPPLPRASAPRHRASCSPNPPGRAWTPRHWKSSRMAVSRRKGPSRRSLPSAKA